MTNLKEIIAKKKERIAQAKLLLSEDELKSKAATLAPTRPFIEAIQKPRTISLIAEIKKASPSAGVIRQDFNIGTIASAYKAAQVQAVSVLTEEDFFLGSLQFINEVKSLIEVPVLRKDFILEPYQVYESRYFGADAVLLIAGILTVESITAMAQLAASLRMQCLVEVHTEKELKKILKIKEITLIGINNRDLDTLEVDLKTTEKLFPLIPKAKVVVVESGLKARQDILFLKILGVNAVLVGEAFMRAPDITKAVEELMGW